MAKQPMFSGRMQQILGLPNEQTPDIKTIQNNPLAATRCRFDVRLDTMTNPPPREDAYLIVVQIQGKNSRELWLDGKSIKTEPLYAGGVVFHDLRRSPTFYFNDPLDSVNYFLPRKTLDVIADDAEVSRISDLKFTPGVGIMDRVVEGLTQVLLPASSDFMRFDVIDHGSWLATIGQRAKAVMVVLGNPLIARTMLRHDVGAGLNVPVRIFIYQHQDGKTRVAYDLPSTLMSNLKGDPVAEAASKLDAKLVALAERISGVKADARACSD